MVNRLTTKGLEGIGIAQIADIGRIKSLTLGFCGGGAGDLSPNASWRTWLSPQRTIVIIDSNPLAWFDELRVAYCSDCPDELCNAFLAESAFQDWSNIPSRVRSEIACTVALRAFIMVIAAQGTITNYFHAVMMSSPKRIRNWQ
jgi:hypothetical protein